MPSWAIHLAVGEALSKNMEKEEKQKFTFGNLLPDVNVGFLINPVSKIIPYEITHHGVIKDFGEKVRMLPDYKEFIQNYSTRIKEPAVLGYLAHLATDYYWNYYTYIERGIYKDKEVIGIKTKDTVFLGEEEIIRQMKVNDFNHFSSYLYQNKLKEIPMFEKDILELTQKIQEVHIENQDIEGVNQYFTNILQNLQEFGGDYQIFTPKEMEECLEGNISFIERIFQEVDKDMF